MNQDDIKRMLADGKAYEQTRTQRGSMPLLFQLLLGALIVVALGYICAGCTSTPRSQEYLDARSQCEANAAPARGLAMSTIYNHCMQANGFK